MDQRELVLQEPLQRLLAENQELRAALEMSERGRVLQAQGEELSRLLTVSKLVVSELDLAKVFELVADNARELVDAELVLIPMLNEQRDRYTYVESSGANADDVLGISFPVHVGMCGWVLQHERSLLFGNDTPFLMDEQTTWERGQQSAVLVPLFGRHRIIGGLSALGKRGGGSFTNHDLDLLTIFANQISAAVENATLFHKLEAEIEERKLAQENLVEVMHRLELAAKAGQLGIWDWDIEQDLMDWNPRMLEIYGISREQFTGTVESCYRGIHPDDREGVLADCRAAQQGTREFNIEYRLLLPNGTVKVIKENALVLRDAAGNPLRMIGMTQDITKQRWSEEIIKKQVVELGKKNAELERFTYTISHDLKSPIITIKGFLGTLVADAKSGNFERLESDVNRIAKAADKMRTLLEDVLELSRIGRMVNPAARFSMTALTNEAIEGLHAMIKAKGVAVSVMPEMPEVLADRHRIREVMQNLIENAVKYTGNQAAPRIEVGCRIAADDRQVFFVKDNGLGIAPKFQHKVFDLFEKLDPHSEGTGIGLALVKRIIELHGGSVWIESLGLGEGTTFCFTLPQQEIGSNADER